MTRKEALAAGATRYFTGKACKSGHIAERRVSDRSCCACRIERKRASYPDRRDSEIARVKAHWAANPDKNKENGARWLKNNREIARASVRRWNRENPEKVRELWAARRARLMNAEGKLSAKDVKEIAALQGGRCAYCKKKTKMTVDHIVPLIQGGRHSRENIQMTCASCNSAKGGRHPIEFAQKIGLLL